MNDDYATAHRHRGNLVIHLIAVPLFVAAHAILLWGIVRSDPRQIVLAVGLIAFSLGVQKLGHGMEPSPPQPFAGPVDFLLRIYTEQFYGFWVFVLRGGW